jgi:hypothetical protein
MFQMQRDITFRTMAMFKPEFEKLKRKSKDSWSTPKKKGDKRNKPKKQERKEYEYI